MTDTPAGAPATPDPRLAFSNHVPNLQVGWDSTSLGELKTCPRKYYYSMIRQRVPRIESVHLKFGIAFHSAMESYDRMRAEGASPDAALCTALRVALDLTWDHALGRPWTSDLSHKTRITLVRTIVWYLEQFAADPAETFILRNGKPAVEMSFRFESGYTSRLTGEPFLLCGHMDRVVRFQDKLWVLDYKTTKSIPDDKFFAGYSPDNQVTLYTLAGRIVTAEPISGIIIAGCQVLVNGSRFQRNPILRTQSQLEEWLRDLGYWLNLAEAFAEAGYWPQNDKACGMYGGCPYRDVCAASPEVREPLLAGLYSPREWDPLKPR